MASLFLISFVCLFLSVVEPHAVYELKEDLPLLEQIGRLVPCSAEEKRCFQHGRIYNIEDGKCYVVGSHANCPFGNLFLDRRDVLERKILRGKCSNNQPCDSWQVPQDGGLCQHPTYYCKDENKTFKYSFFGDRVSIDRNVSIPYVVVQQPKEEGLCRIPDLRAEQISGPLFEFHNSPCSEEELLCFIDQRVRWPGDGRCYELLTADLCEEGEWLIADEEKYGNESGPVIPICRLRPCPNGEVLMQFDGKCHSEKEVLDVWCSGGVIETNIFGISGCTNFPVVRQILPVSRDKNGMCSIMLSVAKPVLKVAPKSCPKSNKDYCPREIEAPEPDLPDLD